MTIFRNVIGAIRAPRLVADTVAALSPASRARSLAFQPRQASSRSSRSRLRRAALNG